jgi:hypothetical protein
MFHMSVAAGPGAASQIEKETLQIGVSISIKVAISVACGGADPPPAEHLTPETKYTG